MKKEALGVSETFVITYDCTLYQNLHCQHYVKPATQPKLYSRCLTYCLYNAVIFAHPVY